MRKHILLLFLTLNFGAFSQEISNSDFENSDWFAGISGAKLFESDSLIISKIVNLNPKKHTEMSSFVKMDFLNVELFSTLEFKNNDIFIEEVDKEWCGFNFSNQINWKFDKELQKIGFYKNESLIAEYVIISKKTEFTEWSNNSDKNAIKISADVLTLELTKLQE